MKDRFFRGFTSTISVLIALAVGGFVGLLVSVIVITRLWG